MASTSKPHGKAKNLLGILTFLGRYPGRVAVCVALLLINISIEMTLPQILGNAIDRLRFRTTAGPFNPWSSVQLFLALVLIRAGVGYLLGPRRNRVIQLTLGDIRAAIYEAIQRLAFTYHDRANSGELISRSTTDVWRLHDFLFACLFLSLDIVVSLIATIALIFWISSLLALVILATMLPTIALIAFYAIRLQPQWRQVHDLHGAMTTVIQENIAGVRVVKAFAREAGEITKFRARKEIFLGTLMDTINYWAGRVPFAQFIFGLSMPLVLWLGGREVIAGSVSIGDLAKVVFYLMAIGYRVGMVGQFTNVVQNASASAERILEIIRQPQQVKSGKRPLPAGRGVVAFEHVSFSYFDGKASLKDVSFRVEAGETIALLGPTGSGKTTLVNLIPRFYDPTAGRILFEGVDVRELVLGDLRRAVSVIFQETFLFSASVAENIAYGKPEAPLEEIEACARAAQAHEFISELEQGYQTIIGERGVSLSGGQKQRIAIARAFLMNPRILILDDATASVDAQTERLIHEAMRRLRTGRTTFVIAHRLSTTQHADRIFVLRQGELVSEAPPAQLVLEAGFYGDLYRQQTELSET